MTHCGCSFPSRIAWLQEVFACLDSGKTSGLAGSSTRCHGTRWLTDCWPAGRKAGRQCWDVDSRHLLLGRFTSRRSSERRRSEVPERISDRGRNLGRSRKTKHEKTECSRDTFVDQYQKLRECFTSIFLGGGFSVWLGSRDGKSAGWFTTLVQTDYSVLLSPSQGVQSRHLRRIS